MWILLIILLIVIGIIIFGYPHMSVEKNESKPNTLTHTKSHVSNANNLIKSIQNIPKVIKPKHSKKVHFNNVKQIREYDKATGDIVQTYIT
jgi:hypothetical protein